MRTEPRRNPRPNRFGGDEIDRVLTSGIVFRPQRAEEDADTGRTVKTKAKKKGYTTGAHGSGSAKKKADIRRRRANRHKS